jgi:hypothetical protein
MSRRTCGHGLTVGKRGDGGGDCRIAEPQGRCAFLPSQATAVTSLRADLGTCSQSREAAAQGCKPACQWRRPPTGYLLH